jgi:SlyX protein
MKEERLIELEIKWAYQEDLLHTLNNIVANQQQQIDRLENSCKALNDKLKSLSFAAEAVDNAPQIPPHY